MLTINKNPQYFLTIVRENSISKAAEKLFISQSYLSQYLLKLEKELDVQLFDRSRNPIRLTEAGRIYKDYLEQSEMLHSRLTSDLDTLNDQRACALNLGVATWRGSTLLPDVLPSFIRELPNIRISLHEHPVKELYTLIEDNTVDVCIMNASAGCAESVTTEFLAHERILLAANRRNPATDRLRASARDNEGVVDLRALENECFVLVKPGLACAEWVNNYLSRHKFFPANQIITTSKTTAINLVAENVGFCFIPEAGMHRVPNADDLEFFDLQSPDLIAPLAAVYKKGISLSLAARKFIDITKNYYSNAFASPGDAQNATPLSLTADQIPA